MNRQEVGGGGGVYTAIRLGVVSFFGREGPTWRGRWQRENSFEKTLGQRSMRRPPRELISCREPDGRMRRTSRSDITKFPFSLGVSSNVAFSQMIISFLFFSLFLFFFIIITFFLLFYHSTGRLILC